MIRLRPYSVADIPQLCEAAIESVDTVGPWLPWCHAGYKLSESEAWINAQVEAFRKGSEYEFAILSEQGAFLGGCGLNSIDATNARANLGYWVRSSAMRKGVAHTAVKLLVDWAFQNTTLNRLEILVATENHRSLGVASKVGAVREGILRERILIHGRYHDAVMFSVLKSDQGA